MRKRIGKTVTFLLLLPLVGGIAIMMKSGALGIHGVGHEFQNLALKMSLFRMVVVGGTVLFGWRWIIRLCVSYFGVEIGNLKYRVLIWYLAAEFVVVASLFWT